PPQRAYRAMDHQSLAAVHPERIERIARPDKVFEAAESILGEMTELDQRLYAFALELFERGRERAVSQTPFTFELVPQSNRLVASGACGPRQSESAATAVAALPVTPDQKRRVRMTLECGDTDAIPKASGAGGVFTGAGSRYQLMHNGVRVIEGCYGGRWTTEIIRLLQGHHEPQEEKAFHAVLPLVRPGGVMLELGSFWGYYSLWFHRQV